MYPAHRFLPSAASVTKPRTPARWTHATSYVLNRVPVVFGVARAAATDGKARWQSWAVAWALLLMPGYVAYTLYIGLSLPIDYFIYHDYAALQMGRDRLSQDLFPASIQSYLNPTGFALLEGMLRAQWPSWWIAVAFASLHSLNGLFVLLICHVLAQHRPPAARRVLWVGGVVGTTGPMLLSVIGTTFLDPLTSVPLLAALWLLLRPAASLRSVLLAAFLAGAGTGLKLSNLPFGLSLAVLVVVHGGGGAGVIARRSALGALAMWAGAAATHGWWSWKLWERFGNPMFPMFNGVFDSPWAPRDSLIWPRFVPHDVVDAMALPFRMALPVPWVYTEAIAPDLFPAAVVLLAVALGGRVAWKRWRGHPSPVGLDEGGAERRFWLYMGCAWILWLVTNGNGRYALPLLLLTGVAAALLALRVLDQRRALALCILLLLLQTANTSIASAVRWSSGKWTDRWLVMRVPEAVRSRPLLFLSVDGVVKSALARWVHPESAFVQLVGATYSVPSGGIAGEWVQDQIRSFPGGVRAVFAAPLGMDEGGAGFDAYVAMLGRTLDRANLAIDPGNCETVEVNGQAAAGPNINGSLSEAPAESLWICEAIPTTPSPQLAAARSRADHIFESLEGRCPDLYRPAGMQTEGDGRIWTRVYPMHDALIVTVNQIDGLVLQRLFGQSARQHVGSLGSWEADLRDYDCSLPMGGIRGAPSLKHVGLRKPGKR